MPSKPRAKKFPQKLHLLLDEGSYSSIISWQPHGRSFRIHKKEEFVRDVLPKYFKLNKLSSIYRQLSHYGFKRQQDEGPDKGGYYHEHFLRGQYELTFSLKSKRAKVSPFDNEYEDGKEPPFYKMKPMPPAEFVEEMTIGNSLNTKPFAMIQTHQLQSHSMKSQQDSYEEDDRASQDSHSIPSLCDDELDDQENVYKHSYHDHRIQKRERFTTLQKYEKKRTSSHHDETLFDIFEERHLLKEAKMHILYCPSDWESTTINASIFQM